LTTSANPVYELTVGPSWLAQFGDPPGDVIYTLQVTNTGNCPDTYNASLSGNTWPTSVPPVVGPVDVGLTADVPVTVTLPAGTPCGDMDDVVVTLASVGDGTKSGSSTLTTTANPVADVTVDPLVAAVWADPGEVVTHTVRVTNSGNCTDTFDIVVTGDVWSTSAPTVTSALPLGVGVPVDITVAIPEDSLCADFDSILVTFISQQDGVTSNSSDLTTWANTVYSVTVDPSTDHGFGEPGDTVSYTLAVTNVGNCIDEFSITVRSDNWIEQRKFAPVGLEAGDDFGQAVVLLSDTLVIGAWGDDDNGVQSGSVYIFYRDQGGGDNWGLVTKLLASDGAANDRFGWSLSLSGDVLVVGAPGKDSYAGAAYIYYRDQGGPDNWGEVTKTVAPDSAAWDRFGQAVALEGDVLVAGAWGDDDNGAESGSAYILYRDQGGPDNWGLHMKLNPTDGALDDQFGVSVALAGDTLVIGAWNDNDYGGNSGSAYIFYRDHGGADTWGQVVKVNPNDGSANDQFGSALSLDGRVLVVGAWTDDDDGLDSGSAYIFYRDQGGTDNWGQVRKILPDDGGVDDRFGSALTVREDTIVVASPWHDTGGSLDQGAAYVFYRYQDGGDRWGQAAKVYASDGASEDQFGYAVTISGDTLVVGARYDDDYGDSSGSAYLYEPQMWPTNAPPTVGPLGVAAGTEVQVTVDIPVDAPDGASDIAKVFIISQGDGATADNSVLTTTVSAVYGVKVDPEMAMLQGEPGKAVTYTLRVTNTGTSTDIYDVTVGGNTWTTTAPVTVGPLLADVGMNVDVVVEVPAEVLCEAGDWATVTFTSQGDGVSSDSSDLGTTVSVLAGVEVDPAAAEQNGDPGSGVVYTLWLTNTGNCSETFTGTVSGNMWNTTLPGNVGPIPAGGGMNVNVTVNVPANAQCDDEDSALVRFSSHSVPQISGTSMLTTTANAVAGVTVAPPAISQSGGSGETLTYTLWVTNSGNCSGYSDTYTVTVSGSQWPTATPSLVGPLEVGAGVTVPVAVSIPPWTHCNDEDLATVRFTSHADPSVMGSSLLTTIVKRVSGVYLDPPYAALKDNPGSTVTYTLFLSNTGNCQDTFSIALTHLWETTAPTTIGPLEARSGTDMVVTVEIPPDAQEGDYDVVTITATSQAYSLTFANSVLTTTAVTPDIVLLPPALTVTLNPDQQTTRTLVIGNEGEGTLYWSLIETPTVVWLDESPTGGIVAPGESADVALFFDAAGLPTAIYTTSLQVLSNDPNEMTATVDVTLVVTTACIPPYNASIVYAPLYPLVSEVITFSSSADGSDPLAFTWSFGDGVNGEGTPVTHTYAATGTFTVLLTASNSCGEQVVSETVTVVAPCNPVEGVAFSWEPLTPTEGTLITFTGAATGTPPLGYNWHFGDGSMGAGMVITHVYTQAGVFTATLTVSNACSSGTVAHAVVVEEEPIGVFYIYLPIISK
jgi:PKD repeat protein/uncharacterized membrane protein